MQTEVSVAFRVLDTTSRTEKYFAVFDEASDVSFQEYTNSSVLQAMEQQALNRAVDRIFKDSNFRSLF